MRFKARSLGRLIFCWAGLSLFSGILWADTAGAESDAAALERSSAAALLAGEQVERLEVAVTRYEQIAADGGWPALPADTSLTPGSRDPRVRTLRQRLRATGDYLAEMGADPLTFDAGLQEAVLLFQQRHGLHPDGVVSGQTLEMLNLPVAARIRQLRHALAGWQQAPAGGANNNAGKRVWVNIPEATVAALDGGSIELRLRAVVGHPTRPTPELSSAITRIVVNPGWNVPQSIAGQDLLPRQIDDAGYFRRNGFRVFSGFDKDAGELNPELIGWELINPQRFPYRLLQMPGPANSLGRYKFDFPNEHDVFLHDTPSQALLGLSVRSLSSGCVRVQNPAALAQWLFSGHATMQEVVELAARDPNYGTRAYTLYEKVPVDLVYLSAWVSPAGEVQFRRDVYQLARATDAS